MTQYRKKPVVIEAVQFLGNFDAIEAFVGGDAEFRNGELIVATLEGPLRASHGDWIIKGVKGEFYPCKPDIFEATYDVAEMPLSSPKMDFSHVLQGLQVGYAYARAGWNGKGMFIFLVPGSKFTVNREPLLSILGEGTAVDYHGHIDMRTANGQIVPWTASHTDMLANDWVNVPKP